MKKNIIISLVLLLLIVLFGMCACSRGYSEGFAGTGAPETVPLSGATTTSIAKDDQSFDTTKLLSSAATLATGNYVTFIDAASRSLKIAKVTETTSEGNVIWDSAKSNPSWKAAPPATAKLTLTSTGSLSSYTTRLTLGSVHIVDITTTKQATELTIIDGDLVFKDVDKKVIWSLLSDEIRSTNEEVRKYINRGSRIYQSLELENLKKKLLNYETYTRNLTLTETTDRDNHNKLVELRRQMDFEIGELNGKGGSKLAVSANTLQSTMYLNLGITVLAASLFVLMVTR